ncbi:hypothetical protein TCAL_02782 [Tigriopus californicus]|uniref:Uncharacterized protein n=1 Tax=Tigriopus californicus TaxID=6832 RepID=A0A553NP56_TIGCA|nr:uncharacterized protein LOC131879093 [Tigriopus californicus]TRY67206.1 hypothetical protein TCAL_02782 [Tigriopus californicus]|eukprot:TCALIF_02782-PA protein Name:"Protein of unknown function" AED:0.00 eAED:0.00 QI:28/1/1/1/1/1/2/260/241
MDRQISSIPITRSSRKQLLPKMKAFVILFAVAAAKAEAQFGYYAGAYGSPLVSAFQPAHYSAYAAPVHHAAVVPVVQGPKYVAKNGKVEHIVYKREAEAEAEADAQYPYYGYAAGAPVAAYTPYGVSAYNGYAGVPAVAYNTPFYGAGLKTYANDAVAPQGYAAKGQYVAQTAGSLHVAKREAEAEPEAAYAYGSYVPYTASAYAAYTPYSAPAYSANYASAYASPVAYTTGYPYATGFLG